MRERLAIERPGDGVYRLSEEDSDDLRFHLESGEVQTMGTRAVPGDPRAKVLELRMCGGAVFSYAMRLAAEGGGE